VYEIPINDPVQSFQDQPREITKSEVILYLAERFQVANPYREGGGYMCFEQANDFQFYMRQFAIDCEIVFGCPTKNAQVCHAWVECGNVRLFDHDREWKYPVPQATLDYYTSRIK